MRPSELLGLGDESDLYDAERAIAKARAPGAAVLDREVPLALETLPAGEWCVWNPLERAWYSSAPVAPITYTPDAGSAFAFTRDQAVRIWVASGFSDVPMPRAAAIELMAGVEAFAVFGLAP